MAGSIAMTAMALRYFSICRLIQQRGLRLVPDEKDPYANGLISAIRNGRDEHFLDRLLTFGIIEKRGTERFGLLAKALTDPELKDFYQQLTDAESRHHEIFIELALKFFTKEQIEQRLEELLTLEAQLIRDLPIRAAVH